MIGDVWLTRSYGGPGLRGWLGRKFADAITFIKPGLHSEYNHAAIDFGNDSVIEAVGRGVAFTKKSSYLDSRYYKIAIYRPLGNTGAELEVLREEALRWLGISYSWPTAIAHLFGRRFERWMARRSRDKICSEFVATVYYDAFHYRFRRRHTNGVYLDPEVVRPRDIAFTVEREVNWILIWKADLRSADRDERVSALQALSGP